MTMKFYKCLFTSLGFLLLFSCNEEEGIKWQLQEQVLSYYKDSVPDKDKYRAALFLLENMDVHYSPRNDAIDSFYTFMDSIYSLPVQGYWFYHNMYNKALERYGWDMAENQINVPDTGAVTARYLIENIDDAYSMWKSWWADEYGFEHFCNYVLPYRMGHEPLSGWRGKYMKQQHPRVERYINYQDNRFNMYGAYSVVNQGMHTGIYYPKGFMPEFPADKLDRLRVGSCQSFADLNIARFRSIGIPVAKDFVPQWGNCRMGHEWVVLLPNEEQCLPFGPNEDLGWHFFGRSENTLPKAFRQMYDSIGNRPAIKRMFGINDATGRYPLENVFDGDVLTFYNRWYPDGGWAAVEFEEPARISRVRFLPRNDDNFIREGEQYELFYWDNHRFASIARMEGNEEGVLHVDSVPAHALLLLRNLTKGIEERIFTYEKGEQVWW